MNFNFGEHYYEGSSLGTDLLVTVIGGFIGFGFALLIYYLQNQHDKKKEIVKERKELRDILTYLKFQIEGIFDTNEKQQEKSKEFIEAVRKEPTEIQSLMLIISKESERIHNTDSLRLFTAFRDSFGSEKDYIEQFKKMYGDLDFVHEFIGRLPSLQNDYMENMYKRQLKIKDIVDHIPDYMSSCIIEIKRTATGDYKADPRYEFLNRWILKYRELADSGQKIDVFNKAYLSTLIEETLAKFSLEFFGDPIMTMCKKARVLIHDITNDALQTASDLEETPKLTEKSIRRLRTISKKL